MNYRLDITANETTNQVIITATDLEDREIRCAAGPIGLKDASLRFAMDEIAQIIIDRESEKLSDAIVKAVFTPLEPPISLS